MQCQKFGSDPIANAVWYKLHELIDKYVSLHNAVEISVEKFGKIFARKASATGRVLIVVQQAY